MPFPNLDKRPVEYRPIESLKEWNKNPRGIKTEDLNRLKASIKKRGQFKPLIVTKENIVLGGNMRLKAYKELGIDEVWVSVVDASTDKEKLEYALADNDRAGYYEEDKLAELVMSVSDLNMDEFKVDLGQLTSLEEVVNQFSQENIQEDDAPEVSNEPPVSKLGEVYQLGRHRLMCGDSTKIEDVEKLMSGQKADMVFTDPPYGMNLDTNYEQLSNENFGVKSKNYSKVIGDDKPFNMADFHWIDCDEQFWWGADWYRESLPSGGSWFVWDKRVDENLDNMYGSAFELCWSKQRHQRLIVRHKFAGFFGSEDAKERMHPTQKAIGVCSWFIEKYSKINQSILDLFGGSGSTLIACEQTNRTCYMCELDPKYCDVIRKRYAKFIGKEEGWQTTTFPIQ